MTEKTDTSPKRLRELATEYRADKESPVEVWETLVALAAEKEAQHPDDLAPIAVIRYHNTGGNVGLAWSAQPHQDYAGAYPKEGEFLYRHHTEQPLAVPADVPLPEPYAWQTVGGSLFGHKPVEEDMPLYDKEQMRQYGQACAKAARDAAFDNAKCSSFCAKAVRDAERERLCSAIKAADDKASEGDYMLDSDDCINVIKGLWVVREETKGTP